MPGKISIGIAGAGTMGTGIAFAFSSKEFEVTLYDSSSKAIGKSGNVINEILASRVDKGKLTSEESERIIKRTHFTDKLNDLENCSVIIEAIIEDLQSKQNLFASLETHVPKESILATNTSSLSVTSIASACKNPERIIGMHFFNPAFIMPLVEIVPGLRTSHDVVKSVSNILKDIGKETVTAKDTPGYIVNRIARPFYGEALRILEEGIANIATIDWAMKEFGKFKMGPFELMDLIGIDVNYAVTRSVFEGLYFDPRYKPSILQKNYVDAGMLGKKTGRGFYNYKSSELNPVINENAQLGKQIFLRIIAMLINEAADAVLFNIASIKDIDLAVTKGVNYPKGLLRWADEIGLNNVLDILNYLYEEYKEDRYRPSPLLKRLVKENKTFYLNTE